MNRVLIVGIPRSGTTWVGRVLEATDDTDYLGEPDNPLRFAFAFRTYRRLGMGHYPLLDSDPDAAEYERLWSCAFGIERVDALGRMRRAAAQRLLQRVPSQRVRVGVGSRSPGLELRAAEALAAPEEPKTTCANLVVKSVYAPLSIEWIATQFPLRVTVVLRNPLSVLSSWAQLQWLGRPGDDMLDLVGTGVQERLARRWQVPLPKAGGSVVARAAWMIGAFTCALTDATRQNPTWTVVTHEELCAAPAERYPQLAAALGLSWGETADGVLAEMNRPGEGLEPFRVASDLTEIWRRRLRPDEVEEARSVLGQFPLDERLISHAP